MKKCPYCAEEINDEAVKCKHCGSMLDKDEGDKIQGATQLPPKGKSRVLAVLLSLLIPGVGQIYNGHTVKGIIFIIYAIYAGVSTIAGVGVPAGLYLVFYILCLIDAYYGAKGFELQWVDKEKYEAYKKTILSDPKDTKT